MGHRHNLAAKYDGDQRTSFQYLFFDVRSLQPKQSTENAQGCGMARFAGLGLAGLALKS